MKNMLPVLVRLFQKAIKRELKKADKRSINNFFKQEYEK